MWIESHAEPTQNDYHHLLYVFQLYMGDFFQERRYYCRGATDRKIFVRPNKIKPDTGGTGQYSELFLAMKDYFQNWAMSMTKS